MEAGAVAPSEDTLRAVNRRLYDDTDSAVWQLAVYSPVHEGRSFVNMGGMALLDRIAADANIGPSTRVLDLCCGTAAPSVHLAERTGCSVTGVEMNPRQAEQARNHASTSASRVTIFEADATAWRSEEGFDVALTLDSLMLIADWRGFLESVRRSLVPKGRFFASLVCGEALDDAQRQMLWEEDGFISLPTAKQAAARLAENGLRDVEATDLQSEALSCLHRIDDALSRHRGEIEQHEGREGFAVWRDMSAIYIDLFETGRLKYILLSATAPS